MTKVDGSDLQSLFATNHDNIIKTIEGRVFIDRDPNTFLHLLNYLECDGIYSYKWQNNLNDQELKKIEDELKF